MGQPGTFYAGLPAGGVWKSTSAGETWYPVFDDVKTVSSIGAVEVAPSEPNIVYVGTGDMVTGGAINEGNGVYRSSDAGRTWTHLGLDSTKQIPSIVVDPRHPTVVMIAAQGDIHSRSSWRGVFRSVDGGRTWNRTLFVDDQTGVQKLARAPDRPDVIFATTVRHYTPGVVPAVVGPPADTSRTGTAIYKSIDNGVTWNEVTGTGLPRLTGRTSIAVANNTDARRVYLIGNWGLYRSDDGGSSWRKMASDDSRIANGQGGYNCGVYVDPQNPDMVYTISTSSYRSVDGGNTFTGFKGAPGGDDPQQLWIDPTNGQRMLLGLDQGATVTLDGGATWSSWYNQSTEQIYHISVDNSYPYWVYGTQQDAGAVRQRSRGNYGAITVFDWGSVNGWEWGTVVADPRNPNVVCHERFRRSIIKITYPSEQWISVSPNTDPAFKGRTTSSQPMVWAPWDQRELITGFQYVMSTTDGGAHWNKLSPDLTIAPNADSAAKANPRGAIESLSASAAASGVIWVGTNNGRILVTRNHGKTWDDASIANLPNPARASVAAVTASHHDAGTAYAAVDFHGTGNFEPWFYRTHDYGKTWTRIVTDLPVNQAGGSFARVIRDDPVKSGLLYAGTESGAYVSFDDGDHWQSLQLNLPLSSVRDIVVKDNDLVLCTYGRGIWIIDDISILRQLAAGGTTDAARLFKPGDATRVRRNVECRYALPAEIPHALNPLDGVMIDYWLGANSPVTLEVLDARGRVVRTMTSAPVAPVSEAARPPHPNFWLATPQPLPSTAGAHRVNWDLRYDAPPAFTHSFEINANPGLTPASPLGPLAPPGTYTIRLTADGKKYSQTVAVRNDPRSPATPAAVAAQHCAAGTPLRRRGHGRRPGGLSAGVGHARHASRLRARNSSRTGNGRCGVLRAARYHWRTRRCAARAADAGSNAAAEFPWRERGVPATARRAGVRRPGAHTGDDRGVRGNVQGDDNGGGELEPRHRRRTSRIQPRAHAHRRDGDRSARTVPAPDCRPAVEGRQ